MGEFEIPAQEAELIQHPLRAAPAKPSPKETLRHAPRRRHRASLSPRLRPKYELLVFSLATGLRKAHKTNNVPARQRSGVPYLGCRERSRAGSAARMQAGEDSATSRAQAWASSRGRREAHCRRRGAWRRVSFGDGFAGAARKGDWVSSASCARISNSLTV